MVRISETLRNARSQVNQLRDAIAVVSANSTAGTPDTLAESAATLEALTRQSERDFERVNRLVRHLGALNMSEAASTLCQRDRKHEAQQMLALSRETEDVANDQVDVTLFIEECLESLSGLTSATAHQTEGGRFIGSA